jgi:hypothetical protein
VVFKQKIWVIGGDNNTGHYQTDVWSSVDGRSWQEVTDRYPWSPRVLSYVAVYNGAIYVIGGQRLPSLERPVPSPYPASPELYDDVWRSADGYNWQPVGHVPHALGMICGSAVFNGELYVVGGGSYADETQQAPGEAYAEAWSTGDGATWTQHVMAAWPARRYHGLAVAGNAMFVIAGTGADGGGNDDDVWYTTDAENWTAIPNTPWTARHALSVAAAGSAIYITGGTPDEGSQFNDVWTLSRQ